MIERPQTPAFSRISPVNISGRPSRRLMIVLRTRGCEYARETGGCTVCGFLNHADEGITESSIQSQLDLVLSHVDLSGVEELDLLTLGSFLNNSEMSVELRRSLLQRVAELETLRRVSFESRAEYITREKLEECRSILIAKGPRTVELGIGLESADDRVRNEVIRKGLSKDAFLAAVDTVAEAGLSLLVYLLIKPQGLSEREAIDDAVASARFVFETAARHGVFARVAFEPVFICENTELETLYTASEYRLVNLWSVVDVISQIHGRGDRGSIFIGLSDEDLSDCRVPWSCDLCHDRLVTAIEAYNSTQDLQVFDGLDCECREAYLSDLKRGVI